MVQQSKIKCEIQINEIMNITSSQKFLPHCGKLFSLRISSRFSCRNLQTAAHGGGWRREDGKVGWDFENQKPFFIEKDSVYSSSGQRK